MTRFRSRRITDLKQSELRDMTRERLLGYAEEDAVLHKAVGCVRFHSGG